MATETQEKIEGEIGRCRKGAGEIVVVSVAPFRGRLRLDVRVFWQNDAGEWLPTRKGVSIGREDCHEFARLVREGVQAIAERGVASQKA
jgi:hypothetical protein